MADADTSSLQVQLSPPSGGGDTINFPRPDEKDLDDQVNEAVARRLVLEIPSDVSETLNANEVFVDLYPNNSSINTFVTAGILFSHSNRVRDMEEFLSFEGNSRVQPRYAPDGFVNVQLVSSFRTIDGGTTFPNFTYDSGTNEINSSETGWGLVRVTYTTSFKRQIYQFDGACPLEYPEPQWDGTIPPFFTPATMVATWDVSGKVATATLALTNDNERCVFDKVLGEDGTFVAETDGPSFGALTVEGGVKRGWFTRVKVYPSNLNLTGSNTTISIGETPSLCQSNKRRDVRNEPIVFSNSYAATSKYPPENFGSSRWSISGTMLTQFGKTITEADIKVQTFSVFGTDVNLGTWKSPTLFIADNKRQRVRLNEIVITDLNNNVLPVYGAILINYEASFDMYLYEHTVRNPWIGGAGDKTVDTVAEPAVWAIHPTSSNERIFSIVALEGGVVNKSKTHITDRCAAEVFDTFDGAGFFPV